MHKLAQSAKDSEVSRPLVVWALLAVLIIYFVINLVGLVRIHLALIVGPDDPRHTYYWYVDMLSLALLRTGVLALSAIAIWRKASWGLFLAAIVIVSEFYANVFRDFTGGQVPSFFSAPSTQADALARAIGRYSFEIFKLYLIAACMLSKRVKAYFRMVRPNPALQGTRDEAARP